MRSLKREGITLSFEEASGAAPPVVLLHGWCCDLSYLAPQFDHYARRGHRVVAVDLRGHGQSDKPQQAYTMSLFADDVAWLCRELGITKPIVIGHSMGGIVAYDLAARYPDLPAAIVMLDSAIVLPESVHIAIPRFLDALRGPDYAAALCDFIARSFLLPSDDAAIKDRVLADMAAATHHVMVSAFEGLRDYNASAVAERITAASLYIAANEPQPRSDMGRLRALLPRLFVGQTVGSGHFCQLQVPDQIHAMIERFLAIALRLR